ncbi:MAG TPA: hypothetical protein VG097_05295, partial [Gemmata sp.]|nr:hypothetical protein [Gemmata sp.]
MNEEPQSETANSDPLDTVLFGFRMIWLGLLLGAFLIMVTLVCVVIIGEMPDSGLGEFAYIFLLPVPLGLVMTYFVVPMFNSKNPVAVVRSNQPNGGKVDSRWERSTPEDPYYWSPAYGAQLFIRLGCLEGPLIMCLVGFVASVNWIILFATIPL